MSPFHKKYDENQKVKDVFFEKTYNVKIIRLNILFKVGSRVFYIGLKKVIERELPDILFLHGLGDFKDILFLYGKNNYLTFRDCHMSWVASKNKFAKLYYKLFSFFFAHLINNRRKYEKIYALGNEEREYIKALGISDERIEMLPHGYNENTYFKDDNLRNETRKELSLNESDILISYIGKFDQYKEPHVNLDIFSLLGTDFIEEHNLKFLFLGPKSEDYMTSVFMPRLEKFKYKERVMILDGKKADDLISYYNASDICLWPKETTLSSIHAQVSGCPVIMENHESNKERVIDQYNLFDIGNITEAKNILFKLVRNVEKKLVKVDVSSLENREYHKQIQLLITSWKQSLLEREK
jgi:glycosyltransferase involved in cell wall biosynthesis